MAQVGIIINRSDEIVDNFRRIKQQIVAKEGENVVLLPVAKTYPAVDIRILYAHGARAFGENYLQEALQKQADLTDLAITWHYIGHIQRNKTTQIATHFDWVQTLDRIIIADRLNKTCQTLGKNLNVLIALNIDNEPQKSGVLPEELLDFLSQITEFNNLILRGLMVIPKVQKSDEGARATFLATKKWFDDVHAKFALPHWDTLSMGMSGDFLMAIECGSTLVRLGTAIFGARDYADE